MRNDHETDEQQAKVVGRNQLESAENIKDKQIVQLAGRAACSKRKRSINAWILIVIKHDN